jgi:hypothetical protein
MAAKRRVSVTLDGTDEQAIAPFVDPARPEHATLEAWAVRHGLNVRDGSDAAVLRTLVLAGAEALREVALEEGYTRLAAERDADQAQRRAVRDRAVKRSARFAE